MGRKAKKGEKDTSSSIWDKGKGKKNLKKGGEEKGVEEEPLDAYHERRGGGEGKKGRVIVAR